MRHACARHRLPTRLVLFGLLALIVAPAWAEQVELVTYYPAPTAATDTPPPKPFMVYVPLHWRRYEELRGGTTRQGYSFGAGAFNVYAALQLWRFGVARTDVRLATWDAYDAAGNRMTKSAVGGIGPVVRDGVVVIGGITAFDSGDGSWAFEKYGTPPPTPPSYYAVEVTW